MFLTLGHAFGVRIHRVLRVPRVVVAASPLDTLANGQPTIGRPFYGQAKGQLRLTCAFYAECAHEGSKGAEGVRQFGVYSIVW